MGTDGEFFQGDGLPAVAVWSQFSVTLTSVDSSRRLRSHRALYDRY